MAKIKKKSRSTAEKANKKEVKKKLNPFEVHVNKEKLKVLGKRSKNDRGLPGVSREKAINKRKHTLLQEYKLQNKSNKFIDKRIGEKNKNLNEEDKFIARYAKLRAKSDKKSRFNLADEVLTHRGQVLSEIEKFEDNHSEDDSDDDVKGGLQSDFVEKAHFGGGIFEKGTKDGAKSHKDLIDQLIAESKKRKAEKQKLKEQTLELTEKLDSEWKDLIPLVNKKTKNDEIEKPKVDDFDKVMRELKFEARGHPSDRLKSEEEIAKEEKEKLEKLEDERLKRMHGVDVTINNNKRHHGADDLDDNFEFEEMTDAVLSYDFEGKPNLKIDSEINGKKVTENVDEESKDQDESDSDNVENNVLSDEEEDEDNFSDLKEESDVSDEENSDKELIESDQNQHSSEIVSDLLKRKAIMEKAREELPYTFKLPKSYEELNDLLIKESPERQNIIIERMIKCNHPSLGAANKEQLSTLFIYLIQYINDLSQNINENCVETQTGIIFRIFYNLLPHFYDLAHLNSEASHKAILEVIKEKHGEYKKSYKKFPGLEVLLFLKLIGHIFSTSDFKHSVVTPSFVFIDQMLNNCRIRTEQDVAYGLFLCTLVFEFTKLSKRYLPSTLNYLSGILYLSIPKTGIRILKISQPFKTSSNLLVLVNNHSEVDETDLKLSVENLRRKSSNSDDVKISSFYLSLNLIEEVISNISELPSRYELLINIEKYLNLIPLNNYPGKVKKKAEEVIKSINKIKNDRIIEYLTIAKPRPKALRLYEPNIQKIYDGRRHKLQSKEKSETDKLIHKVKKERKGALREIRRDQAFLAKVKIKKQIQSDNERKDKVKRLFAEAAMQQSELNAFDRKKKKK
ncbi:nucleolar protein 14 homolog [Onthophagus taurus]|uniref:nucleolar protein 14 homolog n=1 Tax=Onthophagus taurus TaxID=166361 RepID=UPI0039BEA9C5